MSIAVFQKLLAIFLTVGVGFVAARAGWLGPRSNGGKAARLVSDLAFYVFVPALLFRTVVRLDFATLPWRTLLAFFVPAVGFALLSYAGFRRYGNVSPAAPATRTVAVSFGNTVQLGIPMAAALFGEAGLALHIAIVSLHALVLLTLPTVLVELDLARAAHQSTLGSTLRTTLRNTLIHPVTLPVVAGGLWNATGLGLHPVADETLAGLGQAVVPVCLVLIGMTMAVYGVRGRIRTALVDSALKLLVLPALVLPVAHWGFGLSGMPLAVVVVLAGLPSGSNALVFAQRYDTLVAEANATIVLSTTAFALTASMWLGVLALLPG
ncbi:MAG: AEC family transporter [Pseudomonadota bacterium]|nr:AEC family transporter [Pseudomonadota bacterium]